MNVIKTVLQYLITLFFPAMLLVMFANAIGLQIFNTNLADYDLMNTYFGFESLSMLIDDMDNNLTNIAITTLFQSLNRTIRDAGIGLPQMFSNFNLETFANFIVSLLLGPFTLLIDVVTIIISLLIFVCAIFDPVTKAFTGYYNLQYYPYCFDCVTH